MGDVVHLPRDEREIEAAASELHRYLESTPSAAPSEFKTRFDAAAETGRVHRSPVAAQIEVDTWRLSPQLNELLRRETIIQSEYDAAMRFLRDCFLGPMQEEGAKASSYGGNTGSSSYTATEERETRRLHHRREFFKAWQAIDSVHHPALAWLVGTLGKGAPLQALGHYWAPHLGKQTQSARGGATLAMACLFLCRYYGIKHPLDVIESLEKLTAKLLESRPA